MNPSPADKPDTWRLIRTPPAGGSWNMAVDEMLLRRVGRKDSPPILRLYGWQPPCLSIGYAQSIDDVDRDRLKALGWDLVRRPTGGKAILHTDELTYAVITPHDEPRMAGGILSSYRQVAEALLAALLSLEIPAKIAGRAQPGQDDGPVCFEAPSDYEITVDGKKILGSAQARRNKGILQHGTFPLEGDLGRINQVLMYPNETARQAATRQLHNRATTAKKALGRSISMDRAMSSFVQAFQDALRLEFQASDLSALEIAEARELESHHQEF